MKKYILFLWLLLIIAGCENVDKSFNVVKGSRMDLSAEDVLNTKIEEYNLPENYLLEVPFVMQAPFANWSEHNESCEEAGILLVHYYYQEKVLTKQTADDELKDMVLFQHKNYGGEYDIFAEGISRLAADYYGVYQPRILVATVENMKQEIMAGNPIIVPTTAAYLKPEKSDYPEMGYHVVVIVGYNQYGFVTHDVGTYSGENFTYSYNTLLGSMDDYGREVVVLR